MRTSEPEPINQTTNALNQSIDLDSNLYLYKGRRYQIAASIITVASIVTLSIWLLREMTVGVALVTALLFGLSIAEDQEGKIISPFKNEEPPKPV